MPRSVLPVTIVLFCIGGLAQAAPVVVFRDEFAALQAGRRVVIEDFQGFDTLGPQVSPMVLNNGVFNARSPYLTEVVRPPLHPGDPIPIDSEPYPEGATRLLSNHPACDDLPPPTESTIPICQEEFITFTNFRSGTIAWAGTIAMAPERFHHFDILVEGRSGILTLTNVDSYSFGFPTYFAFADDAGLVSVSIRSLSYGVYGPYDVFDIRTIAVPEPSGGIIAVIGLVFTGVALRVRMPRGAQSGGRVSAAGSS